MPPKKKYDDDSSALNNAINNAKKRKEIRICSIDIGNRNFALCVELCPLPLDKSDDVCNLGEIILFKKEDFGAKTSDNIYNRKIFFNCEKFLDSIFSELNKCDIIIIEQQLKRNPFAQKLEMFVYSYFLLNFGDTKYYNSFPASHKTRVLKAPKGMNKPERKKWCAEKFCEILANRGDVYALNIINENKSKIDDLCDTGCMIQAFKILHYSLLI